MRSPYRRRSIFGYRSHRIVALYPRSKSNAEREEYRSDTMKNSKMWMGIAALFCALACGCKASVEETGDAAESTSTSTDECDPALDYAQQEVQCGDGDPCTVDRCDLALKTCINRRIQDCITKGPQCSDVTAPSDCSRSANPCYSGKCNDAGLCMLIPGCYSK